MKILKGFAVFVVIAVGLSSCFDEPTFGPDPVIEFRRIEFIEVGGFAEPDSLTLYIDFQDGDGDLGLSPDMIDNPYHPINFFVGDGTSTTAVSAGLYSNYTGLKYKSNGKTPTNPSFVIDEAPGGLFVSFSDQGVYGLPPNAPPYTCEAYYQAYLQDTIFIRYADRFSLKPQDVVDTLVDVNGKDVAYAALATWYTELNPAHYNITIRFYVKQSNGTFQEYDFREEFCTTYDGRFPVLSEDERPLEGSLKYALVGTGFLPIFSVNTLRLEIEIRDRATHVSNTVSTQEFTLNGIKK